MPAELLPFAFHDPQTGQVLEFAESYRDDEGTPYATSTALGGVVGYANPRVSISNLLERHPFILEHTSVINLMTPSGTQDTRVFSPIAVFLVCMKANTSRAKEIQLLIARFLDAWRKGDFTFSRVPVAAQRLDGGAFIELIRSQRLDRLFDQARRGDETGERARWFLDALGFGKTPKPALPGHDTATCPYRDNFYD